MATRPDNSFTTLGNVPVHYNRDRPADYPTRGRPYRYYCTQDFENKLDACIRELWNLNPYGKAEVITSAGAFVDKPSFHGQGRAFDLDGIFWSGRRFITLYDGYNGGNRKFYFGIEAVLRKHFGTVLDYNYNAEHRDHFHVDDGSPVGFRPGALSLVKSLQATLVYVFGLSVGKTGIDGDYGNSTKAAVSKALARLEIAGDIANQSVWLKFLTGTARTAFGSSIVPELSIAATTPPLEFGGGPISIEIKAENGIENIIATGIDSNLTTRREANGLWIISAETPQFGEKTILVKGFNGEDQQVAETTVAIAAERSANNPYQPPENSLTSLGAIVPVIDRANHILQPFVDGKIFLELEGGELYIDGSLPLSLDGSPRAAQFDPCRGYLTTSLRDPELSGQEQYVNSEEIPYIALPEGYEFFGVALGDIVAVIVDGQVEFAVFANVSHSYKLLSGSLALARSLVGDYFDGNISSQGISENVIYLIFPGSGDGTPQTPEAIRQIGRTLFERLGGQLQANNLAEELTPQNQFTLLSRPIITRSDEIEEAFSRQILEEIAHSQEDTELPIELGNLPFEAIASDVDVLARTIYGEARSEVDAGRIGVAYTVVNRVSIAQAKGGYWWGNTIREVCLKPSQYSCWNRNDPNRAVILAVRPGNQIFDRCLVIARQAIDRAIANPVRRSAHYYSIRIPAPIWARGKRHYVQLGVHKFYENIP